MTILRSILILLALAGPLAAQYAQFSLPVGTGGRNGTIHLFLFDQRSVTLKVIDQESLEAPKFKNLGEAMKSMQCIAGCNGGFFTPEGQPLGLAIADGKAAGTKNLASSLTSGVLYLDGTRLRLERSKDYFSKNPNLPSQLLQTGPFLVEDGKKVAGLSSRRFARRSFILTDGDNRWAIGYCPSTSLDQLAAALADPKSFANFNVTTALNLDGGSSSALWVKTAHHPFYLREIKPVRNFLGIIAK
jgi:uncharacterized protein YigE (DUF2233 family)